MFKMFDEYIVNHDENRMNNEGDVASARRKYYSARNNNLFVLLQNRYEWMNKYIDDNDIGIEFGAGSGFSKEFIKVDNLRMTDYAEYDWLDEKQIDALNTPYKENSFDFIVSSNMIHHIPYPLRYLKEMSRILKPDGKLLIQDVNASVMLKIILRLMKHEGYSYNHDVFDVKDICTKKDDLWSGNNAIPNLLFDDIKKFNNKINFFKVLKTDFSEFLLFLNSGGVVSKTFFIPLPVSILKLIKQIDLILCSYCPRLFALQRRIVLLNIKSN